MSVLPGTINTEQTTDSRIELNRRWIKNGSVISGRSRRAALNPSGFEVMVGVLIALLIIGCVGIYFDRLDWVEARKQSHMSYTAALSGAGSSFQQTVLRAPIHNNEGH